MRRGVLCALFALAACTRGPTVVGWVEYPATMPLRAFPVVLVASGYEPESIALAQQLVRHLNAGEQEARRVSQDDLEPMRLRGEIPAASVVVLLELSFQEHTGTRFSTRPETVCGPAGCYQRNRTEAYDVPTLDARVRLTVFDGPSAQVLQRLSFDVTEEGRGYGRMRERALAGLSQRLVRLVEPRVEDVRVKLLDVEVPAVRAALEAIRGGDWREGRVRLERAVRSEAVRALEAPLRARVFYDLAQARRFDPVSRERDLERHFEAAEVPLRRAIRLDPDPRYDAALRELRRHREQLALHRAQQEAAEHNFRLGRAQPAPQAESADDLGPVPPPPPAYE